MDDDPLVLVIKTVLEARYSTWTYVDGLIRETMDNVQMAKETLKSNIMNSDSSKRETYREMSPDLKVHEIYSTKHNVQSLIKVSGCLSLQE